ncbi:lysozyme c-1-like [Centruroides vittatus]|uniref:lysozyme c-1-like n=1 Tax=Centruroides vittatus TaxID=120091 RepID=UPI00350EB364
MVFECLCGKSRNDFLHVATFSEFAPIVSKFWLCLIRHESNFNSRATNRSKNGSKDHGIFQINDRYWCSPPGPQNGCNVKCSSLLDDNLAHDMRCAKIIYSRRKFNAWYGWINHCRGKNLQQYVKDCKY